MHFGLDFYCRFSHAFPIQISKIVHKMYITCSCLCSIWHFILSHFITYHNSKKKTYFLIDYQKWKCQKQDNQNWNCRKQGNWLKDKIKYCTTSKICRANFWLPKILMEILFMKIDVCCVHWINKHVSRIEMIMLVRKFEARAVHV